MPKSQVKKVADLKTTEMRASVTLTNSFILILFLMKRLAMTVSVSVLELHKLPTSELTIKKKIIRKRIKLHKKSKPIYKHVLFYIQQKVTNY